MNLPFRDVLRITTIGGGCILIAAAAFFYSPFLGLFVLVSLGLLSVLLLQTLYFRQLQNEHLFDVKEAHRHFRQIEALLSLHTVLSPVHPLPPSRGWVISPDFGQVLVSHILRHRPATIVELGSGLSTLLSAYCLKKIGTGKVISLDHEEVYAQQTRDLLKAHGLEEYASVIHAPLVETEIDGRKWTWYDFKEETIGSPIDLLTVDGPPESIREMARFPALPKLHPFLSERAHILVDDAKREDDRKMVEAWMRNHPGFEKTDLDCEKGAVLLKKIANPSENIG